MFEQNVHMFDSHLLFCIVLGFSLRTMLPFLLLNGNEPIMTDILSKPPNCNKSHDEIPLIILGDS